MQFSTIRPNNNLELLAICKQIERSPHELFMQAHRYKFTPLASSKLEGYGWPASRSSHFNPANDLTSIVQKARWTSWLFWTGKENLPSLTGIRSPERPTRSRSVKHNVHQQTWAERLTLMNVHVQGNSSSLVGKAEVSSCTIT